MASDFVDAQHLDLDLFGAVAIGLLCFEDAQDLNLDLFKAVADGLLRVENALDLDIFEAVAIGGL